MTDIEVVIKIDEKAYRRIQGLVRGDYFEHDICGYCMGRIADGIPLPKGHGDLIDKKVAYRKFYARSLAPEAMEVFAETPVVIEADRARRRWLK